MQHLQKNGGEGSRLWLTSHPQDASPRITEHKSVPLLAGAFDRARASLQTFLPRATENGSRCTLFASFNKRPVAFPPHGTSRPLKKTPSSLTMESPVLTGASEKVRTYGRGVWSPLKPNMGTLNRTELDRLERRELQLTILAAALVLVQAAGLAMFMYPLVFLHPIGNKWTLRVAFFGFCALTLLFVGYLLERQRTVRKLKEQILAELERNVTLQHQASVDLLQTMPDQNHFWDRLTMEYRRAMTMQKTLSILLVKAKPAGASAQNDGSSEAWSDAAKAMSRKLRPTDSIYRQIGRA